MRKRDALMGLMFFSVAALGARRDIKTSTGPGYCHIDYFMTGWAVDTLDIQGQRTHQFRFDEATYMGVPGDPALPSRVLVVGVPPRGDVSVTVTGKRPEALSGVNLIPLPHLERQGDWTREVYRPGDWYEKSGPYPAASYRVSEPEWQGRRRIVRITLHPVQYQPLNRRVTRYQEMTVDVRFSDQSASPRRLGTPGDWASLQGMINSQQARFWQKPLDSSARALRRVQASGFWYRIPVTQEGVYQITGEWLADQGVDIASIDPATLKILGNGGRELPRDLDTARPDSLIENPVWVTGESDGSFDARDALLFYGKGVNGWQYASGGWSHYIHHYTEQNTYWLVFGDGQPGLRMETAAAMSASGATPVTSVKDRYFLEQEQTNVTGGGLQWFGRLFTSNNRSFTLTISRDHSLDSENVTVKLKLLGIGQSGSRHPFQVAWNDQTVSTFTFSGSLSLYSRTLELPLPPIEGDNRLTLTYNDSTSIAQTYLDWVEVESRREVKPSEGGLRFEAPGTNELYDYSLSDFGSDPLVLDVSDIGGTRRMSLRNQGNGLAFADVSGSDAPSVYFAARPQDYLTPGSITEAAPPALRDDLSGADMIIVTHSDFWDAAQRLKTHRETFDTLSVAVVDIQDLFNEFAWGLYDPVAIRDFVHFAVMNWARTPSYLLLMGDGDYDYKNRITSVDKNWIPPLEYDSMHLASAIAFDDWYTYVLGDDRVADLSVGRLPVRSASEAETVVTKIIEYESNPDWDTWRLNATLVADDEKKEQGEKDALSHTTTSEFIATQILPDYLNVNKVFMTEYEGVIEASGLRKPDAVQALLQQIDQGTVLVNFIGHGHQGVWAHEWVFNRDRDLPLLNNSRRLPLFYAATCSFGRYDKPDEESFAELLVTSSGKGGIAVIAASRDCFVNENEAENKAFYRRLFPDSGPVLRVGDAHRLAKLSVGNWSNAEKYHLFGDPALRLGVPKQRMEITSIEPDSLKALSVFTVRGTLKKDGQPWTDFNGTVHLKAFDSFRDIEYTTYFGDKLYYTWPGNALYRGESQTQGAEFEVSFIVPKDISYGTLRGRLSGYFSDGQTDGAGSFNGIPVAGSSGLTDDTGPAITLGFDGYSSFFSGDLVNLPPRLTAEIEDDKTGVNITGDIGHHITLSVDGQPPENLTDYFNYQQGSYLKGSLAYTLEDLDEGEHILTFKAWDNANNSSVQTVMVEAISGQGLVLEEVLNYPNPTSGATHFTFRMNRDAEVVIKIYTVSGLLIRRLDGIYGEAGFNMIPWDGRDHQGDVPANGVYLYRVIAKTSVDGERVEAEKLNKLMIVR